MPNIAAVNRVLGAHMSTAGGLKNSLVSGKEIGCAAVQLFTSSPKQWNHPPLDPVVAEAFRDKQIETGIQFTVAHDSYLINLASSNPEILEKSHSAFVREMERAEMCGIPWLVTHMGARLDSAEEVALKVLCESLKRLLGETEKWSIGVALETTAGQGTTLGRKFEHIAQMLDGCGHNIRLGVCLDTCHIFAAGYDIRDEIAYDSTFKEFGEIVGFTHLKVIHANDSKKGLGSLVDRHEHIGGGEIGEYAFSRLVTDPRMLHVPIIIETPEIETMHAVNLAKLKKLAGQAA